MASVESESRLRAWGWARPGGRLYRAAGGMASAAPAFRAFPDRRQTEQGRNSGPVLGRARPGSQRRDDAAVNHPVDHRPSAIPTGFLSAS